MIFMKKYFIIIILGLIASAVIFGYLFFQNKPENNVEAQTQPTTKPLVLANSKTALVSEPISNALARVTKKPFGLKVSPKNSPVQPERFSGYHTGVDFETTASEQNIAVPIMAICAGKLIYKNWVNGYGGVAIESCVIDKQAVTIIYGHLKLASLSLKTNSSLKAGQNFAVLGKGYSTETNGERKHLHLGIHKGTKINFLGYVQNKADLVNWLDITKYLAK
jgi:hypothetical protein